jgi:hypothetical protein
MFKQEYEKRKKETIDKIVSGQVETQVGSASAYIAGPLSAVGEVSTNRHQQCPPATKPPSAFTRNAKPPPPPKALIQPQHVRKEIQHDLGSHSRFTNPEPPKFHSVSKVIISSNITLFFTVVFVKDVLEQEGATYGPRRLIFLALTLPF